MTELSLEAVEEKARDFAVRQRVDRTIRAAATIWNERENAIGIVSSVLFSNIPGLVSMDNPACQAIARQILDSLDEVYLLAFVGDVTE